MKALVAKQIVKIAYYTCLTVEVRGDDRAAKATRSVSNREEIKRKCGWCIAKCNTAGAQSRAVQPERQQNKAKNPAASQH